MRGAPGVWEMTWRFAGPDGPATWEWTTVEGEAGAHVAVRCRRIGGHATAGRNRAELARRAEASEAATLRALRKLAEHGLVEFGRWSWQRSSERNADGRRRGSITATCTHARRSNPSEAEQRCRWCCDSWASRPWRVEANVTLALDRNRVGTLRRRAWSQRPGTVWTSEPISVWCDLYADALG